MAEIRSNRLRVWAEPLLYAFLRARTSGGLVKTAVGEEGGARTCADERGCLSERFHAPQDGRTPLHHAAVYGDAAIVERLLAAGAVADAKDAVREGGGGG